MDSKHLHFSVSIYMSLPPIVLSWALVPGSQETLLAVPFMRRSCIRGRTLTLAPTLSNPASTSHPVTDESVGRHRALALIPRFLLLGLTSIHQLMEVAHMPGICLCALFSSSHFSISLFLKDERPC